MLSDKQIKGALDAEANEATVPSDLIRERIRRAGGRVRRPGLWRRFRVGRRLEVAVVPLLVVGLLVFTALSQADRAFQTGADPLSEIREVQLYTVWSRQDPVPLSPNNKPDWQVVERLWSWVQHAESLGPEEPGAVAGRIKRPVLVITLKDGRELRYTEAYDCAPGEEGGTKCWPVLDQITAWESDPEQTVRLRAPELAAFLQAGWREHLRVGPTPFWVEIDFAQVEGLMVKSIYVSQPDVWLDPKEYADTLHALLAAWNSGEKEWGPAPETPLAAHTVEVHLKSGHIVSLPYMPEQDHVWVAQTDAPRMWVRSATLKHTLEQVIQTVYP